MRRGGGEVLVSLRGGFGFLGEEEGEVVRWFFRRCVFWRERSLERLFVSMEENGRSFISIFSVWQSQYKF